LGEGRLVSFGGGKGLERIAVSKSQPNKKKRLHKILEGERGGEGLEKGAVLTETGERPQVCKRVNIT